MAKNYSRLKSLEERKKARKAVLMVLLAVSVIVISIVAGFRLLSWVFLFVSGLNPGNQTPVKEDMIPPAPPRIFLPYEATNSARIRVSGSGEPGAMVFITQNREPAGNVMIDGGGSFSLSNVGLIEGENEFLAVAMDVAGNKSQPSARVIIDYLKDPPRLDILSPADGDRIRGNEAKTEVKGQTDPGTRVTVNDRVVIVSGNGNFSYLAALVEGENQITVAVTDGAGNRTLRQLKVFYAPGQ